MQYIVSLTVGGTVACWYFLPLHPAPLKSSLFRACTYSFGSVCYGALLVAILHTLRYVISLLKRKERRRERDGDGNLLFFCFLYLLDMLVGALEGLVMYINKYAYSYIAAYGLDFYTSGKHVYNLFERRGWV
ncbi:CTL/SLC44 family protein, partial [archaeon]